MRNADVIKKRSPTRVERNERLLNDFGFIECFYGVEVEGRDGSVSTEVFGSEVKMR